MKVQIEKDIIEKLLGPVQSLVEKRNVIPILSKVLIKVENENLKIFSTDQENSLQSVTPIKKGFSGEVCVDSRTLFEIVKELPSKSQILLEKVKSSLRVSTPSSVFNMVGVSPEDFPVFPEVKKASFFELKAEDVFSAIDQTLYCVSMDETRYHLNGVFLEKKEKALRFVSTDGHRLSFTEIDNKKSFDFSEGIIIPRKGLNEIQKLISTEERENIEIAVVKPRLLIKYGVFLLSIRLIEGKYPNYKQLIPKKSSVTAVLNKENLIQALKRVSILSNPQSKNVHFHWKKKVLILTAKQPDSGDAKEEVSLNQNNKEISIRFNAKYVLEAILHIDGNEVTWEMTDPSAPGLISSKTSSGAAVIMPMKL